MSPTNDSTRFRIQPLISGDLFIISHFFEFVKTFFEIFSKNFDFFDFFFRFSPCFSHPFPECFSIISHHFHFVKGFSEKI